MNQSMIHHAASLSAVTFFFAAAASFAATPAREENPFTQVRAFIQGHVDAGYVPSVSVAVAIDGKVLWEESFGWADVQRKVPATPHTLYSLASVSKPITATGLMVLVNRGAVSLDKPINDYLGAAKLIAYVGNADDATVRRVANHTSGLPNHFQFFYEDEKARPPSFDESIRRYGRLMTAPGQAFQYSNFGFGLIEDVIARVSKTPYEAFMDTEVFKPLGMNESVAGRPRRFDERRIAKRYTPDRKPIPYYDFDHRGASVVYSSAHDLLRFGMFFLKNRLPEQKAILPDAVIDEMLRPSIPEVAGEKPRSYGIGWSTYQIAGDPARGHSGRMPGVSTDLTLSTTHDMAIVVLMNAENQRPVIEQIDEMIYHTLVPSAEKLRVFAKDSAFLGVWHGFVETYDRKIPVVLTVDGTAVRIKIGEAPSQLVPDVRVDDAGSFWLSFVDGDLRTDAGRYPYRLYFKLSPNRDSAKAALSGPVTALSDGTSSRGGYALSSWVKLAKP